MSFHSSVKRGLAGACAAIALVAAASPCLARDGDQPAVRVSSDLEREWVLQLSPGSGVVPGYRRPNLSRGEGAAPAARSWPGYSAMPPAGPSAGIRTGAPAALRAAPVDPAHTGGILAPARRTVAPRAIDPAFLPQEVAYETAEQPGTVIIDTGARFLYLVEGDGRARRYGVGVGKPGFEWAGRHEVTRKSEWPTWTPPEQMRAREKAKGRILPVSMSGGPENPLGARAMYLGSTLYRIHGTNQPWSIGKAVSSGCIRMRNEDVMDLYDRVPVGTGVVVL